MQQNNKPKPLLRIASTFKAKHPEVLQKLPQFGSPEIQLLLKTQLSNTNFIHDQYPIKKFFSFKLTKSEDSEIIALEPVHQFTHFKFK